MVDGVHTNGTNGASPAAPRIPKREVWVDVPEYPGFKVLVWVNYPQRLNLELNSGEIERVSPALRAILLGHNGWINEDGETFPDIDTDAFWQVIPDELSLILSALIMTSKYEVPKLLTLTRTLSRSGTAPPTRPA